MISNFTGKTTYPETVLFCRGKKIRVHKHFLWSQSPQLVYSWQWALCRAQKGSSQRKKVLYPQNVELGCTTCDSLEGSIDWGPQSARNNKRFWPLSHFLQIYLLRLNLYFILLFQSLSLFILPPNPIGQRVAFQGVSWTVRCRIGKFLALKW